MDIRNNRSTSISSWDLDMSIGNQLLLDQTPFELLHPIIHPFQGHIPSPSFPGAQIGAQREVEGENEEEEEEEEQEEEEGLGAMKEMMYKIAAMQPVDIDPSTIKKPKRRNVRISDDPQSIAARHRRERISERIRILQRLVPGGTKMDTASMLDEAIRYVKFLKRQVQELQSSPLAAHVGVVGAHPAVPADWFLRPDTRGSSSSSSTMGAPSGLGFNFAGDDPCNRMG